MVKMVPKYGFMLGIEIEFDEFELKASGSVSTHRLSPEEELNYQQRLNGLMSLTDKELDELDEAIDMQSVETELAKLINAWSDKAAEKQLIARVREMRKKS